MPVYICLVYFSCFFFSSSLILSFPFLLLESSTSVTSYIVQVIYIHLSWIIQPLQISLLPLILQFEALFVKLWLTELGRVKNVGYSLLRLRTEQYHWVSLLLFWLNVNNKAHNLWLCTNTPARRLNFHNCEHMNHRVTGLMQITGQFRCINERGSTCTDQQAVLLFTYTRIKAFISCCPRELRTKIMHDFLFPKFIMNIM